MSLELVCELEGHQDRVWHVSWSSDGKALASCGGDKTIRIYTEKPGEKNWVCCAVLEEAQGRTIRACEWSPCRRYLAAVSFDATTVIWEKQGEDYEVIATLEGHESEVKSLSWSTSGGYLATCSRDKSVWIWEADPDTEFECISVLHGHEQDVKFVKFHPSSNVLFSTSYDDSIRVWNEDEDDWYCAESLEGHSSTVWGLACEPTGRRVASCSADRKVIVWTYCPDSQDTHANGKPMKWKSTCQLSGFHTRTIFSIDWAPVTKNPSTPALLVTGAADNHIRVFQEGPGETFELACDVPKSHAGDVNCVRWNPDATHHQLLASAGDDSLVRLWKYSRTSHEE